MLAVSGLHVSYGPIKALTGVDLTVNQGEIVCLLGSNAAGKSTTMKAILGTVPARKGSIAFLGEDVTRRQVDERVRRGIALVPEGRGIFPRMDVRENLLLGAFLRTDRDVEADVEQVLALFPRLKERWHQGAATLSGGEQQMLAIGRALMARPKLMLLDEPSLGLAPILVEKIFATLVEINRQGTTLLLVEQNANVALSVSHRAYVIQKGQITLSGPAAELLADDRVRGAYLGTRAAAR